MDRVKQLSVERNTEELGVTKKKKEEIRVSVLFFVTLYTSAHASVEDGETKEESALFIKRSTYDGKNPGIQGRRGDRKKKKVRGGDQRFSHKHVYTHNNTHTHTKKKERPSRL